MGLSHKSGYLVEEGRGDGVILLLTFQGVSDSVHWQLQALQHEIPLSLCAS